MEDPNLKKLIDDARLKLSHQQHVQGKLTMCLLKMNLIFIWLGLKFLLETVALEDQVTENTIKMDHPYIMYATMFHTNGIMMVFLIMAYIGRRNSAWLICCYLFITTIGWAPLVYELGYFYCVDVYNHIAQKGFMMSERYPHGIFWYVHIFVLLIQFNYSYSMARAVIFAWIGDINNCVKLQLDIPMMKRTFFSTKEA